MALSVLKDSLLKNGSLSLCETVIILFYHNQVLGFVVDLHLSRSVLCRQDLLSENVTRSLYLDDTKLIASNSDNALEALHRAKA